MRAISAKRPSVRTVGIARTVFTPPMPIIRRRTTPSPESICYSLAPRIEVRVWTVPPTVTIEQRAGRRLPVPSRDIHRPRYVTPPIGGERDRCIERSSKWVNRFSRAQLRCGAGRKVVFPGSEDRPSPARGAKKDNARSAIVRRARSHRVRSPVRSGFHEIVHDVIPRVRILPATLRPGAAPVVSAPGGPFVAYGAWKHLPLFRP